MTIQDFSQELFTLYGPVTRARNCFLYTKKGVRITDLYQENGRAILGWDGGSSFTHLKNVLSRGQTGSFICEETSRLSKAIDSLFCTQRIVFFFADRNAALKAGLSISPENTSFYKPWCDIKKAWSEIDAIILEPPLPWTQSIFILAVKEDLVLQASKLKFEGQIFLPFALQAAITRSIYNLLEALQFRQEKDWFIYDSVLTKYFKRTGPYLESLVPQEKYDAFVLHCLKLGIAINPDFTRNSIVPFGADKGVFTVLKNSPFDY